LSAPDGRRTGIAFIRENRMLEDLQPKLSSLGEELEKNLEGALTPKS